jgi:hypothetical protein
MSLAIGVVGCARRFNEAYCVNHGDDPEFAAYCHNDAQIPDGPPGTYRIVVTVDGLAAGAVVLQDNGGDDLTAPANGTFFFATSLAPGATYDVVVTTQPTPQTCTVMNGSGVVGASDVTDIAIRCGPGIQCGMVYCLVGDACCYVGGVCNSASACSGVKLYCDDTADCGATGICCGELKIAGVQRKQAVCVATVADCKAADASNEVLCDPAGDPACTTAEQCMPSSRFIGYHSCQ